MINSVTSDIYSYRH